MSSPEAKRNFEIIFCNDAIIFLSPFLKNLELHERAVALSYIADQAEAFFDKSHEQRLLINEDELKILEKNNKIDLSVENLRGLLVNW